MRHHFFFGLVRTSCSTGADIISAALLFLGGYLGEEEGRRTQSDVVERRSFRLCERRRGRVGKNNGEASICEFREESECGLVSCASSHRISFE